MTREDIELLDRNKNTDKEWFLLRNEPNVFIKTIDDVEGVSGDIKKKLLQIKDEPLKGDAFRTFNTYTQEIVSKLESGQYKIKE